jgi:multisubunit Na+/H+ antiporter MnhC subunit
VKEGDESFERWVSRGVGVALVLTAIVAVLFIVGLVLGLIWAWRAVL